MNMRTISEKLQAFSLEIECDRNIDPDKKLDILNTIDDTHELADEYENEEDPNDSPDDMIANIEALMLVVPSAKACYVCQHDHAHTVCDISTAKCKPAWKLSELYKEKMHGQK